MSEIASSWLPNIVSLKQYNGDFSIYIEEIYSIFKNDFIVDSPTFKTCKVIPKRYPEYMNRPASFWHIISEGLIEDERQVDLRRCEKISWTRPHIENAFTQNLKVWTEVIRSEQRIHIWNEHDSYLVVLSQRNGYFLLWTAYPIDKEHQKNKLSKRWEKNK